MKRFAHYAEFWPHYLHQHTQPGTRALHVVGSFAAVAVLALSVITQHWWGLLVMPVAGYAPAWLAHALIEGNAPATFYAPLRSLIADAHMIGLWLAGQLAPELRKYHVIPGENRHSNPIGRSPD
jgi:hypothetical protein